MKHFLIGTGLVVLLAACAEKPAVEPQPSGLMIGSMDTTIVPGSNFYGYANGQWLRTAEMPPGLPYNGNLIEIDLRVNDQIEEIIKGLASDTTLALNSPEGQVVAFYNSFLNSAHRDSLGVQPIQQEIDQILAAGDHSAIASLMGVPFQKALWGGYIFLDAKDPTTYITMISQSGLGIESLEAYTLEQAPYPAMREAYQRMITSLFEQAGISRPAARAKQVLDFETQLAKGFWTATERRNPNKMYHKMSRAELIAFAPGFDWTAYWKSLGHPQEGDVVVQTDTAVKHIAEVFGKADVATLQSFMLFHLLKAAAPYLSEGLSDASFDFYGRVLYGIPENTPLEDRAILATKTKLAEQIGNLYADKYYTKALSEQTNLLVDYLKAAVLYRLQNNDWMDDATKAEAVKKFQNIHWKIGRPERVKDYTDLKFEPNGMIHNVRLLAQWDARDNASRLTEGKRDWEWLLPPSTANAYYQSEMNDVVLPVGILQPPVFDPNADAAANFGGVLAIVGHEVGHGFDDKGSQSDADGVLRNWWTDASRKEFERRGNILVEQYNGYSPLEGVNLNGRLTLGENIGDQGGMSIALQAYHTYVNDHQGGEAPVIDGFTGDQRLFIAFAQLWRMVYTDAMLRNQALTDNHSPGRFRVDGVVRNLDEWYEAFGVQPGDSLYLAPEDRVRIW